jgi:hypothetical protein
MKKTLTACVFLIGFYSCRKEVAAPQPQSNVIPGTITGKVAQFDQYGVQLTTGLNTAVISIDGTSYSTTTDAAGNYMLTNVAPGTYNISFNRPGCGLWQKQQVSFAGNGTYYLNGYSTEKPTYSFTGSIIDSIAAIGGHKVFAYLQMSPITSPGGILILRSQNPNLNINDPSSYQNIYQNSVPANTSSFKLWIDYAYSGTWYYKAYPYPNIYYGAFYDDAPSEKRIYSAYGNQLPGTFTITIP